MPRLRAPRFWHSHGVRARLLAPLSRPYLLGLRLRRGWHRPRRPELFTLCIGNGVLGGAGKTPLALDLGRMYRRRGRRPHYLTRGYGGRERGPLRVDPTVHRAADIGDEAWMLAHVAPCWVGRDRILSAEMARRAGADILIMDDGFHNPAIDPHVRLMVVDAATMFGNRRVFPAGPLRDDLASLRSRTDAIVRMDGDRPPHPDIKTLEQWNRPLFQARLSLSRSSARSISRRPVYVLSAIADPEKFLASLERVGCLIRGTSLAPDHAQWSRASVRRALERAETLQALPVTTAKDYPRIPQAYRSRFTVVRASISWSRATRQGLGRFLDGREARQR